LLLAIVLNLSLTVVEVAGGVLGGSLSLLADALHNFNDCASLLIAWIARRISRKQADKFRTFGYRRAEVVGALINLTTLVLVSLYLIYEAFQRFLQPQQIHGWTVIVVAIIALLVDVGTVLLLAKLGKSSVNVRAATLHNLSDALASVGVLVVGVSVWLWNLYIFDVLITLLIAGFILWQSVGMLKATVAILMESVPSDLEIDDICNQLTAETGVVAVHHLHVWQLDERQRAFEAHIVIDAQDLASMEHIKQAIKSDLAKSFQITHSTLEFEVQGEAKRHDTSIVPPH
jgi:cobalt-zinc-cadmium efflux system protein